MVSKASELLPEPLNPVMTVKVFRGISTLMFFRLCWRAPCTDMRSSMYKVPRWKLRGGFGATSIVLHPPLRNRVIATMGCTGRISGGRREWEPGMAKNFKDLSEREILGLAISLEEEDGRILRRIRGEFAGQLSGNFPDAGRDAGGGIGASLPADRPVSSRVSVSIFRSFAART